MKEPVIIFLPDDRSAAVRVGTSVLDASRRARVTIRTRCGGVAGCLMCKIRVPADQAGFLSPPTEAETRKLGQQLLAEGHRLSCQAKIKANVTVEVPEDPLKAAIRKRLAEQEEGDGDWFA